MKTLKFWLFITIVLICLVLSPTAYQLNQRVLADTVGAFIFISASTPSTCTPGQFFWNTTNAQLSLCPSTNVLTAVTPMKGTTGTITGTLLAVGSCDSGTATVSGATAGQPVSVSTSDGTFLGGSFIVRGDVTSSNTVTVNICATVLGTPASKTYNVEVGP